MRLSHVLLYFTLLSLCYVVCTTASRGGCPIRIRYALKSRLVCLDYNTRQLAGATVKRCKKYGFKVRLMFNFRQCMQGQLSFLSPNGLYIIFYIETRDSRIPALHFPRVGRLCHSYFLLELIGKAFGL